MPEKENNIKKFLEWIGLKEKIHNNSAIPPFFKEGEIWWCYIGENVGNEINGKSKQFSRPIFIFKKYDKYSFLGLPLTTKLKNGTWYVEINFSEIKQTVVLSQGRVFDYRRFKEKIGELDRYEVQKIRCGYEELHSPKKIDLLSFLTGVVGNPKYEISISSMKSVSSKV